MAEMTAASMVEWLTSDKAFGSDGYSRKQIAALIEQQAQEISKLKAMLDCGVQEMAEADKEIAKKDRMIGAACSVLTNMGIGCPASVNTIDWPECDERCDADDTQEIDCWRKWLEKEAEGGE